MLNLGDWYKQLGHELSGRGRRKRRLAAGALARFPPEQIRAVQERHSGVIAKGEHHRKWLKVDVHMQRAAYEAMSLGLHESRRLRVLDIGSGAGFFLEMSRHLGHDVLGLDRDDNEVFEDFIALMDLPRVVHSITPFAPLPDLGAPFDLITAFQVRFNYKGPRDRWTRDEWLYFVNDCRSRLAPGGRLRFQLNPENTASREDMYLSDEIAGGLRAIPGAHIPENKRFITVTA